MLDKIPFGFFMNNLRKLKIKEDDEELTAIEWLNRNK